MARAQIEINGVVGSDVNFALGTLATFTNAGDGTETAWLWELLEEPSGVATVLTGETTNTLTFTPIKRGTYLVQLTVNPGAQGALTDRVVLAVRHLYIRVPASKEQLEAGSDGWAPDLQEALVYVDALIAASFVAGVVADVTISPYVVGVDDRVVLCNLAAPGPVAITLPAGATHVSKRLVIKDKKGDAGTTGREITITPNGAETIDGNATKVIYNDGGSVELAFGGTEWSVSTHYLARDTDTKHNLLAVVPPVVTDDATVGYKVGSIWVDTVTRIAYICTNPAGGAAVWEDFTSMAGVAPSTEPYLTDGPAAGLSAEVNVRALLAALSFIAAANIVPVIIKGSAGHTVALFQVVDSADVVQVRVLANGKLDLNFGALLVGDLDLDGVAQQLITKSGAGDLVVGTEAGGTDLVFRSLGVDRWRLSATGEIVSVGADRQIQGVADPTAAQHAATKGYVDVTVGDLVDDLPVKATALCATTAALAAPTFTYNNAPTNPTLTAADNSVPQAIDGITPVLNDLVLIKNEVVALGNGLYSMTQAGDGATVPTIYTRVDSWNKGESCAGWQVFVSTGTANADSIWRATAAVGSAVVGANDPAIALGGGTVAGAPADVGTAAVAGTATTWSRGDHVHALPESVLRAVAAGLTTDLAVNARKITNLDTPTAGTDAATKAYVDGLINGFEVKQSVVAASTVNINLAVVADPNPVDGVTIANGERVLLRAQTAPAENGIYVATTAVDPTSWVRAADMAATSQARGNFLWVEEGTLYADTAWMCSDDSGADVVGTHALTFAQYDGLSKVTAGAGMTKTGNTINVIAAANGGLAITADAVAVNLNDLAAAAVDPTADSIAIIDATDSSSRKEAIGDLVTALAGDGIQNLLSVLAVDVSDFAGAGLEDDGAENLRLAAATGAGLTGGGVSALAVRGYVEASAAGPASIALAEDTDNGANTQALTAAAAIAVNSVVTFPDNGAAWNVLHDARSVATGAGLAGGGNLTADRTLRVNEAKVAQVSLVVGVESGNVVPVTVQLADLAGTAYNAERSIRVRVYDTIASFYAGTQSATATITLQGAGDGMIDNGSGTNAVYATTDMVNGQLDLDVTDATGGAFTRLLVVTDSALNAAAIVLPNTGTLTWDV